MKGWVSLLTAALLLAGCRSGTAQQELVQLRARVSTLEAENAQLRGQTSIAESERDQLRQQVTSLATEAAKANAAGTAGLSGAVAAGENLVVVPAEVRPGEWVAVYVRNYPLRLLNQAGVALRGTGPENLARIGQLAQANVLLLPIPKAIEPGSYKVVLGEAGQLGPGAKLDDQVSIVVR